MKRIDNTIFVADIGDEVNILESRVYGKIDDEAATALNSSGKPDIRY